jgi:hypothetical protein
MTDRRLNYHINLAGNIAQRANQFGRSISDMAQRSSRDLGMLSRGFTNLEKGMDRVMNRTTGLLSGVGGAVAVRYVMDLDERIARLGVNAGVSAGEMNALKKEIYEVSQLPEIRIDPAELTSAVELIVEKTGDLEYARRNMETFAKVMSATGAGGEDIGALGAEFLKFGITAKDDVAKGFAILNDQGKAGAFTLKSLASLGPRVVSAYAAAGRTGLPALREMGAALQVIRQGTGSDEQAATAFEALMRQFSDAKKVKDFTKAGIQLFDPEKLKKGERVLRPVNELIVDIIGKTKGDSVKLSKLIPDAEAQRAFNASVAEFKRTGSIESLRAFLSVQGDVNQLTEDSARISQTAAGAWRNLTTAGKQFADNNLAAPLQDVADWANKLDPAQVQDFFENAKAAALGFLAVWATVKTATAVGGVLRGGASILGTLSGKGSGGGVGGIAGAATGATPVFVVNMPGGGLPGGGVDPAGGAGGAAGKAGRLARMGRAAGAVGAVGAAGYAGYQVGTALYENQIQGTRAGDMIGESVARLAALMGNKEAQDALDRQKKFEGSLKVEVSTPAGVTASVTNVKATDGTTLDVGNTTGAFH